MTIESALAALVKSPDPDESDQLDDPPQSQTLALRPGRMLPLA